MTSNQIKISLIASKPVFYIQLEQIVDQRLGLAADAGGELVVAVEDVVLGGLAVGVGVATAAPGLTLLAVGSVDLDVKWRLADQHVIDDGTEAPQIGSFAIRGLFNDLWSHIN